METHSCIDLVKRLLNKTKRQPEQSTKHLVLHRLVTEKVLKPIDVILKSNNCLVLFYLKSSMKKNPEQKPYGMKYV